MLLAASSATHAGRDDVPWDIEVVADSDSRWKWGAALAARLAAGGDARVHATLLTGRSAPTEAQVREVGAVPVSVRWAAPAAAIARLSASNAQVVVLACVGGGVQAFLQGLARAWAGRPDGMGRPVVVTGYVGLVYENVVDGVLARAGADVVLANCAADHRRFQEIYRAVGVDADTVVRTALPYLDVVRHDPRAAGRDRPYTVTFVTQPGVPETKAQRQHALRQVIGHAQRHPDRRVIVKLRARPRERTTHVEAYHYASLVPSVTAGGSLPANVEFVYGPMAPVLDQTDLCVTVSSTAAVEAMHRDIPTAILTDFGVREALGNQVFLGSGALVSWSDLHDGAAPTLDRKWAREHGIGDESPYATAARRTLELVRDRAALPPLRPWLSDAVAPGYLPGLLARYGLDPHGVPVASGTAADDERLRIRAARAVVRRAYALGVHVIEPRMKRLAGI